MEVRPILTSEQLRALDVRKNLRGDKAGLPDKMDGGKTPQPNLVDGMRWLQGTFGIRSNAFDGKGGPVFQSRYKSLVVEERRPLLGMVNDVHLNPVRAAVIEIRSLPPFCLVHSRWLGALEFPDSPSGTKCSASTSKFRWKTTRPPGMTFRAVTRADGLWRRRSVARH